MSHAVTVRVLAVAACGWLLAGEAGALTLGRARGAALIGRPLEVAIPVSLDGPSSESPCPRVDLFYGEGPVTRAPSVRWEASSPTEGVVRIVSQVPVDEPMVTVYLRVGCAQASTRRYVLLAELPPDNEPAVRPPLVPAPSPRAAAPAAAPTAGRATGPRTAAETDATSTSPRRREPAAAAPAQVAEAAAPRRAAPAPTPAAAAAARSRVRRPQAASEAGPRLKLEPLDLSIDRDPVLRFTPELGAPAAVDPQRRQALAALWQSLQNGPEQAVQDAIRLQGLQRELGSVREASRQNAAALAELRGQVDQARGGRDRAVLLIAGLAAVLAALVAWIAWRWQRARQLERVGRWFEAHGESVEARLPDAPQGPLAVDVPIPAPAAAAVSTATPATRVAATRTAASRGPASRGPASAFGGGDEFQASRGGTLRTVGVEELIDVHDKADFFLSIGETDQALAVLEAHVHDQVETGALAWMDLLELYHSLGRRAEYERLRSEFRQRFTAQVPDFDHFDQPSASLETYSRALSRIVALWPARRVLDVIEESIFRKPGLPGTEPFSLEAYRELVLLYHIAKEMAAPQEQRAAREGPATSFSDTSLQPLNAVDRPVEAPLSERELLMIPPASARLGVDIDLDETVAETEPAGDLPPLDFDISTFDPANPQDPDSRR